MSTSIDKIQEMVDKAYAYGFVTEIEADTVPKGLDEDIVRTISAKTSAAGRWPISAASICSCSAR